MSNSPSCASIWPLIQDRELNQTVKLKSELQQLAQQIMTMAGEQERRAQGGGVDGAHPTDRAMQRRQAERGAPPDSSIGRRAGPSTAMVPPPRNRPRRRAKQQAVFEGEDGDKSGDAGIRTLLDRLRDIPEPLTGP